ncbi:MAG: hypothetical protein WDO15_24285 [Bacteroidota bacterium]
MCKVILAELRKSGKSGKPVEEEVAHSHKSTLSADFAEKHPLKILIAEIISSIKN